MKSYLMRGVPASLQMDAWWMSGDIETFIPPAPSSQTCRSTTRRAPFHMAVLLALILLADWLFWGHGAGLSLVLFAIALAVGVWATSGGKVTVRARIISGALLIIGLLPVLIYAQALSMVFYGATLIGFAAWVGINGQGMVGDLLRAGFRFLMLAPMQVVRDIVVAPRGALGDQDWDGLTRNLLRAWALPVVVGSVFLALFMAGNPMFKHLANQLPDINVDVDRLAFWLLVGVVIWPFLVLRKMRQRMMLPFSVPFAPKVTAPALLNARSVMNSLALFNLMFATQTGLDMVYLWGGASLPDGISLATYAHRGAYPLVATALLAGVFALIARPYVQDRRGVRGLLFLWLAQNIALVAGATLRLDLYVGTFGLTYLRVAAFIWMGMVAAGLVLIGAQLLRAKGNGWLLGRMSVLLVAVLYICSFVNFANLIAASNLSRTQNGAGFIRTDTGYICSLGPMALPAIVDFERYTGQMVCNDGTVYVWPEIAGWREWGFRRWQVQRYLAIQTGPKDVL